MTYGVMQAESATKTNIQRLEDMMSLQQQALVAAGILADGPPANTANTDEPALEPAEAAATPDARQPASSDEDMYQVIFVN